MAASYFNPPKSVLKPGNILASPVVDKGEDRIKLDKLFPEIIFDIIRQHEEKYGRFDQMINCDLGIGLSTKLINL